MSEKKESGSGKVYTCKLCKKTFKQKCDYDKHANKKAPCISLEACEAMIVKKDEGLDSKKDLTTFFKNCLDLLRDNEGLTGEKALRNLSYLLILKLLEPHFGGIIDIDNYPYDLSCFADDDIEHNKSRLLSCVRFSNLSKEKEDNIPNMMKYLWDIILSVHPSTKNIFLPEKKFDIQRQSTYKKIVDKLNRIDLSCVENDILGDSYEEVIQYIMTGKLLGQFFTPHLLKKFMVRLIDPQIFPNGQIESCCDPTMGTGGFLIEYIRVIQEKARLNDISLDWQFIKNGGLYGKELEPDTYQLAVSNMLISTGHMFEKLDRGDSIREPIAQKFDIILSNPPFGIKGLKYDDFNNALKDQYIPIKTDNAVSLFIQAIIFMLKIGGKCAIVLPDGKDLFTKTNATLVAVREYLMKTCDLKEIYLLPSGIFEHTTIKTCIFYFVKRREGSDVLRVKTQKKSNWEYEFSKTLITKNVLFYDYNPYENVKNLLAEVPIEKIASNSYSLNYSDYLGDDAEEEQYEDGIIVKKLGEICEIDKNLRKYETSHGKSEGNYKFHTGGERTDLYVDECDITELYIIQNRTNGSGKCNLYLDKNFSLAKQTIAYRALNKDENTTKYIYYYLLFNKDILEKGFVGTCHKNISKEYISNLKIPVPSIELQEEIVKYLDFIYEKANKTSNEKIVELKQMSEFCLNNQRIFGDNVLKKLGEVCNFQNGRGIKKDTLIDGEYPVIGGGQKPMGFHNQFNTNENTILCSSSGAYSGFISRYNMKVWASDCFKIIPNDGEIDNNYLYYLLKTFQDKIYMLQTGTAQPHIYSKDLCDFNIPIPSLERQKEIVAYCEFNDALIRKLVMEIEKNKKEAKQFLKNVVRSQAQEEDEQSSEE
jgi:type I restriction-modification system DNA methylase subunit